MSSHLLKKLYNLTIYTVGFFVLLAAVVATTIRILLPDVGSYRSEIEAWVSNYMGLPVIMHDINAEWEGWSPQLYMEQIDLLNSAGTDTILHFQKATISIDFLRSLINRQIIPRQLMISGFNITVIRLENGAIDIAGINVQDVSGQARPVRNDELANWLLGQNLINLQNANLLWIDNLHAQPPVNLSNVNLTLQSDGDRLQLQGSTMLPDEYGTGMNFAIDVMGDVLSADWSADIYIQASNIVPDNWYKEYWPEQLDVIDGSASITLWSSWNNSSVTSFNGMLEFSNLNIKSDENHLLNVHHLSSSFFGSNNKDNWMMDIRIDELQTDNGNWPASDFAINFDSMENLSTLIVDYSYLNIKDILSILPSAPGISPSTISKIESYSVSGELLNGSIRYDANAATNKKIHFDTGFAELQSDQFTFEPEDIRISGRVSGNPDSGRIIFNNNPLFLRKKLNSPALAPLLLSGSVDWNAADGLITVISDKLEFSNHLFNAGLSGKVIYDNHDINLELLFDIDEADIRQLVDYIPYTQRFRTRDWIERSVTAGKIQNFKMIYRGNPRDFPFDNQNGQFHAIAEIRDGELAYSSQFPPLRNVDTDLSLKGRELQLEIKKGNVFAAHLENGLATIPNTFRVQKTLNIDGLIVGNITDLKSYINNSSLGSEDMLAKVSDSLTPTGMFSMQLGLTIPLRSPDKNIEVEGQLKVENAGIKSDLRNLELTSLSGVVSFTESSLNSDKLHAKLNGQDVSLVIKGSKNNNDKPAEISLIGKANSEFIAKELVDYYPGLSHISTAIKESLSGTTNWKASIFYHRDPSDNKLKRNINISSDLIGLEIDLPTPFGKYHYERVPFSISRELDLESENILNLKYGEIDTAISFDNFQKSKINSLSVLVGMPYADHSQKNGINITGRMKNINLDAWQNLLSNAQMKSNTTWPDNLPVNAKLIIENFQYLGQTFSDLDLSASKIQNRWSLALDSTDISGNIDVISGTSGDKSINVELETLTLASTNDVRNNTIDPANLPSINAKVTDFNYNKMNLGSLNLTAVPENSGMSVEKLSFNKPGLDITASGKWSTNRYTVYSSNFSIEARADQFSNLAETFGFNSEAIAKADTTFSVDANWSGSPMDFSLDKLNGTISMKMGKGQIRDIKPAAGRLFGLLSLQTLPRRLVLDFSDLFGTGMAFDSISGNFEISEGNAYTDNLALKGPSVNIEISGRTGLAEEDYDQTAIITPQISDSLAVASGFLGPVGVGVGTVLYLAGNMFEPLSDSINKIMKIEYTIEGKWDEPVIKKTGIEKGP